MQLNIIRWGTDQAKNWLYRQTYLSFFSIALATIYVIAFSVFLTQFEALIGDQGLLPAHQFIDLLKQRDISFWDNPTLFWFNCDNSSLWSVGILGLLLSVTCLTGYQNAIVWFLMWVCYISIMHVGQQFYGYGWESLLSETGFFTIFFAPFFKVAIPKQNTKNNIITVLILWILFRNMFGAGLIKLRGDAVWTDLTALFYHFETQPMPNPLSWFFHHLPKSMLKAGVIFNHLIELVCPFLLFMPIFFRRIGAIGIIVFQCTLILSGNLSWLNYLTLVQCIPAFQHNILAINRSSLKNIRLNRFIPILFKRYGLVSVLVVATLILSIAPVVNMLSPTQKMNMSFNRLHLLNTYGAFGHVGKTRYELVVLGTTDKTISDDTEWKEYLFKGKPNRPDDPLPVIAPFHYRLDWQIWFAAMHPTIKDPWLVHFIYKLLINDKHVINLLKENPFEDEVPTYIKIDRYIYRFDNDKVSSKRIWKRDYVGQYCPPLKKDFPAIKNYLKEFGWLKEGQ